MIPVKSVASGEPSLAIDAFCRGGVAVDSGVAEEPGGYPVLAVAGGVGQVPGPVLAAGEHRPVNLNGGWLQPSGRFRFRMWLNRSASLSPCLPRPATCDVARSQIRNHFIRHLVLRCCGQRGRVGAVLAAFRTRHCGSDAAASGPADSGDDLRLAGWSRACSAS